MRGNPGQQPAGAPVGGRGAGGRPGRRWAAGAAGASVGGGVPGCRRAAGALGLRGRLPGRGHPLAGTTESDEEYGDVRHWLLDAHTLTVTGQIAHPLPPSGAPNALGEGTSTTSSGTTASVRL
ncbi:hypothetical protein [Streptomyces sp. NBC_00454]|uniref:hypothetical protein n=1 Tax=Streptomyces sp. NBC_00454 TaxID=2975747 RepID=UPI0030DFEB64